MPHAFYTWQPAANSMHLQQPAFKSFSTTPVSAKRIDTRVTPATCAVLVPNRTPCIDTQRGLSLSTQAACPQHAASQPRIRFQHFHDQCYSIFSTNSAQKHVRRPRVLFASPNEAHGGPDQVVLVTSGAMVLAAIHRVTFSVLAVPFAAEFHISLPDMGLLQSAALFGYLLGQIPAGVVADRFGGVHVLLTGLACWSSMTGLNPLARYTAYPLQALLVMRAALGLAQSVMMPSVSATAARWLPPARRGQAISTIYAASSAGTVLGLLATPILAQLLGGWPACFLFFAGLGIAWAIGAWIYLPPPSSAPYSAANVKLKQARPQSPTPSSQPISSSVQAAPSKHDPSTAADSALGNGTPASGRTAGNTVQVIALCWVHSVIGFGFFILQSWVPSYLSHLGMTDLRTVGALSALPWVGTALAAVLAGKIARQLQDERGWSALKTRSSCQDIATIGPALSLAPLVLAPSGVSVSVAVICLTSTLSLQAFCYAGFHAYVQDVAPENAGKLLGITNTCGTAVGIVGNILTGNIAASPWGYSAVFALIGGCYISSFAVWHIWINGHNITLGKAAA